MKFVKTITVGDESREIIPAACPIGEINNSYPVGIGLAVAEGKYGAGLIPYVMNNITDQNTRIAPLCFDYLGRIAVPLGEGLTTNNEGAAVNLHRGIDILSAGLDIGYASLGMTPYMGGSALCIPFDTNTLKDRDGILTVKLEGLGVLNMGSTGRDPVPIHSFFDPSIGYFLGLECEQGIENVTDSLAVKLSDTTLALQSGEKIKLGFDSNGAIQIVKV